MAFSDARNERDRAETGKNSDNHGGASGDRGTKSQQQDRRNMDNARRAGKSAPGVDRAMSSGSQRHRNRQAEIERVAKKTGTSSTPVGNTGVSEAGRISSTYGGMVRDERDVGATTIEKIANAIASVFGLDEQRPTLEDAKARVQGTAPGEITDKRADWGLDPVAPAMAVGGLMTGLPLGTIWGGVRYGLNALGVKTPTINLGPDVFGRDATTGPSSNSSQPGVDRIDRANGRGPNGEPRGGLMQRAAPPQAVVPTSAPPQQQPQLPPPRPDAGAGFPTPSEKWGGMGFYDVDPQTGQVTWRPVGAVA